MRFALVDGIKQEPAPKLKGVCCNCGSITQAKCGTRKVWHWSHVSLQHCDPWWESETEWHRLWKSYFPSQNQEIIHFDDITGEKHIADIKTDNNMVIEVQNSPMNESEMISRELFYGKMMWIVNGEKFKNNFIILGKLPDPKSKIAQEIYFHKPTSDFLYVRERNKKAEINRKQEQVTWDFHLRSDNPDYEKIYWEYLESRKNKTLASLMYQLPSVEDRRRTIEKIQENYVGHHLFIWKNPRSVWFHSQKPIFIDFGGEELWWLMKYKNNDFSELRCVKKISKKALIEKNGGCYIN